MTVYTYFAFTLTTGEVITEVPLRGAKPSWQVNDPGDLGSPSIYMGNLSLIRRTDVRAATVPWKTGIAVDRDGTIIWAGVVTARRYSSTSRTFSLTVPGLLAYWRRRILGGNITFRQQDQFDIVSSLLTYGGAPTIPLTMQYDPSGVERDRTIAGADQKDALSEILEIADNRNGFELAIDTAWDQALRTQRLVHTLRIGSPRLGRVDTGEGDLLMLDFPGNIRSWTWDEDGEEFATQVYGASTDQDGITVTRAAQNSTLLAQGFPQVGATRQWSNITSTNTIDDHLIQALAEANGYQDAPTVEVPDSGDTSAGSWSVGDDVRLAITDDARFPRVQGATGPGLDRTLRIAQASLDPVSQRIAMTMFGFTEAVQ